MKKIEKIKKKMKKCALNSTNEKKIEKNGQKIVFFGKIENSLIILIFLENVLFIAQIEKK